MIALTALLLVLALLAYLSLVLIIPSCARSLFRYRLWRLRDLLVDEIDRGQYEDSEQPRRLVNEVEIAIDAAPQLTMANLWLIAVVTHGVEPPPYEGVRLEDLSEEDRELLNWRVEDFHRLVAKHVLFGTVSGWLFLGIGGLITVLTVCTMVLGRGLRALLGRPTLAWSAVHTLFRRPVLAFASFLWFMRLLFEQMKRGLRDDVPVGRATELLYATQYDRSFGSY